MTQIIAKMPLSLQFVSFSLIGSWVMVIRNLCGWWGYEAWQKHNGQQWMQEGFGRGSWQQLCVTSAYDLCTYQLSVTSSMLSRLQKETKTNYVVFQIFKWFQHLKHGLFGSTFATKHLNRSVLHPSFFCLSHNQYYLYNTNFNPNPIKLLLVIEGREISLYPTPRHAQSNSNPGRILVAGS